MRRKHLLAREKNVISTSKFDVQAAAELFHYSKKIKVVVSIMRQAPRKINASNLKRFVRKL